MSALGKPVIEGDFDTNGQMVVQSPAERVIERSVVVTRTVTEAPVEAPKPVIQPVAQDLFEPAASQPPLPYPLAPRAKPSDLVLDRSRDDLLTPFGKATLTDRYLMPGESFQDMFARVSCAYADDVAHAQRLYDYMSRLWFMPATPILSNGGTDVRGGLLAQSKKFGMSEAQFDACIADTKNDAFINQVAQDGVTRYGINSTPSIVINGKLVPGVAEYPALKAALDNALAGK